MACICLLRALTLLCALVGVSAGLWCDATITHVYMVRWCGRLTTWGGEGGYDGEESR